MQPEEKIEFSSLMYEIKVLPLNYSGKIIKGGYPDLNKELPVPHTIVLPIELYPPI
jgi:hypothetical protein